jgi:hypothetical protein
VKARKALRGKFLERRWRHFTPWDLFLYGLFKEDNNISEYIAPSGWMNSEE